MNYFEDFKVGQKRVSSSYYVDHAELVNYATKWDPQPFHVDENAAKSTIFGGLTAPACYTIAIAAFLVAHMEPKMAGIALLGWNDVEFPVPVRPGDRLTLRDTVIAVQKSRTRTDRGIVRFEVEMTNENGKAVCTYKAKAFVAKKLC